MNDRRCDYCGSVGDAMACPHCGAGTRQMTDGECTIRRNPFCDRCGKKRELIHGGRYAADTGKPLMLPHCPDRKCRGFREYW